MWPEIFIALVLIGVFVLGPPILIGVLAGLQLRARLQEHADMVADALTRRRRPL
jgi:hypothetical protein